MKTNKIILLLFTFVLLMTSVFAVDDFNRFDGDYTDRFITNEYGLYSFNTSLSTKDTVNIGSTNQILVSDLDNDGTSEVIVTDSDTLYIYVIDDSDDLILKSSYILTGSSSSITPAVFDDNNGDGLKEIVGVWDDFFYTFEYNNSKEFNKLSIIDKYDLQRIPSTNMFCDTGHVYSSAIRCFIPTDDGYIQNVLVSTPIILNTWNTAYDDESNGTKNNRIGFLGDGNTNLFFERNLVLRNVSSGNIAQLQLLLNETVGTPHELSFIYDLFICEFDGLLNDPSLLGDCNNTPTLIGNDINVSNIFGNTTGLKTIPLSTEFYLESGTDYIIIFDYITGGDPTDSTPDAWYIEMDTTPTTNLTKRLNQDNPPYEYDSSLYISYLIGATESSHIESDITPGNAQALQTNPYSPPVLVQDQNDGSWKLSLIYDYNNDNDQGLALIDINTLNLDTQMGGVGYIDSIRGAEKIEGIYPLEFGGTSNTVLHYQLNDRTYISAVDLTGSLSSDDDFEVGTDCGASSKGSMPFQFSGIISCAIARCGNGANSYSEIGCFNLETGFQLIDYQTTVGSTWDTELIGNTGRPAYIGAMAIDNPVYENDHQIIMQRGIFFMNYTSAGIDDFITVAPMTNAGNPNNIHTITVADANDDNNLDILGVRSGGISGDEMFFYTTLNSNQPPIIDELKAYGGYSSEFGILNPDVCLNSNIEFTAQENSNYENDLSVDQERIITNCGYNNNGETTIAYTQYLQNGSYHTNTPSIECFYNKTGVYRVRIFLQDEANDDDLTQYNENVITVHVINGTSGTDCNRVEDFTDVGEFSIGVNGSSVNSPCKINSDCLTKNCEYGVCSFKGGLQDCIDDYECLSGECTNNLCSKPGWFTQLDHTKDTQIGDDDNTNNLLSLGVSIVLASVFVAGSGGSIIGVILGLVFGFVSLGFFTAVGWLSAWIFFALLIAMTLLSFLAIIIFKGGQ